MRIFAIFLVLGSILFAAPNDFTTLKTRFDQRVTNDQNQTINYTGTLWLKQPNFARYDYDTPQTKTITIRGDQVVMIEPDLEQATRFRSTVSLNLINAWQSSTAISKTKRIATINNQTIYIEHNSDQITRVFYTDNFDNFVEILLHNATRNKPIDDGFFAPKIPENYDVINQ